jgi:hypothetical protein
MGGYGSCGVEGQTFPVGDQLSQCTGCGTETTVTPHASFLALADAPQEAYANIARLRSLYPDIYTSDGGFYDAVNPSTGSVGHRRLVLDQSMIMAALDNALSGNALQHYFAKDPVSWAAHTPTCRWRRCPSNDCPVAEIGPDGQPENCLVGSR